MPRVGEVEPAEAGSKRKGRLASIGTVLIILLIYAAALAGYHYVAGPAKSLPAPDLGDSGDTVVQVTLGERPRATTRTTR